MPIITLLTDFGIADSYVAEVKGVLLSCAPDATLIDVTHLVPRGDVGAAQYLLSRAWRRFPEGTTHFAVVDPGVGSSRRAIAAHHAAHRFVAPDNGLLSFLPRDARFVALAEPANAAPTFHGRDLFAPAAAALASGVSLESVGRRIDDPVHSPLPTPRMHSDSIIGEIIYVDHFGNLISNVSGTDVQPTARVWLGGRDLGLLRRTFADVAPDDALAYVGSGGTVEIAVRDGNAAQQLEAGVGAELRMEA
ncbi:MAG TPA: SAM-dependent chlorinase/fluorinase [Gemmatimonadales bacterium]|nr:SAM-dependent chlorinase/fluorinase [Gemmatimonadales bacterium]